MQTTPRRRSAAIGALALSAVVLCAGPAFAHVTVDPEKAPQGGYTVVNFKVPNERDNASTTKLEVHFPTDHPLASVQPQPVPGWDVKVTKSKLAKPVQADGEKVSEAVTKITWSGGKVKPGQFQQFPVSLGELPKKTDQLVFKALQTYSDKDVVRWIEKQQPGQAEPENPAPVLKLTPASSDSGAASADAKGQSAAGGSASAHSGGPSGGAGSGGTDTTARVLGIAGIVIGVAGATFGVLAGRRRSA